MSLTRNYQNEIIDFFVNRNFEKSRRFTFEYSPLPLKKALDSFGAPQLDYKTIHIAGTAGKGSVVHILSKMLIEEGYKVGGFFSPHLLRLNERIMINGMEISTGEMTELWGYIKKNISLENISFFDALTLMSFLHFREERVDWAIIETGLGGRLDSTNNLKAEFTVLTPIGKDHESTLGNSLEKIAFEKAGIINSNPVFSFPQEEKVSKVCKEVALEKHTTISFYRPDNIYEHSNFIEKNKMICEWIFESYFKKTSPKIAYDLPGRLETLSEDPWVIFDSAHNVLSIFELMKWVRAQSEVKRWNFYFNCLRVKNIQDMLEPISLLDPDLSYRLYLMFTDQPKRFYSSKDTLIKDIISTNSWKNFVKFETPDTEIEFKELLQIKGRAHLIFGSMYLYQQITSYFD